MYSKGFRPLAAATVLTTGGGVRAGVLLRAAGRRPGLHPEDLLRARADGDRRAVRLRGRRDHGHQAPAHRRPLVGHALVRGHPPVDHPRRRACSSPARSGPRPPGATGGCGTSRCWCRSWWCSCSTASTTRCGSRSRTPSARRATRRCSPSRPAPSCRSTSWRCAWRSRSPTRACCRRPAAACPATCGSRSWSALLAMTLLFVTLWKLELTSKNASMQLKRLRTRLEAA